MGMSNYVMAIQDTAAEGYVEGAISEKQLREILSSTGMDADQIDGWVSTANEQKAKIGEDD